MKRLLFTAAGAVSALLWAGTPPEKDLVYYSNFDTGNGITAQLPKENAGDWATANAGNLGPAAFLTVDGTDRAFLPAFGSFTDRQNVLKATDRTWTIAFRARSGAVPRGLLFAFGTHNSPGNGGLAVRRGDTPGSLQVTLTNCMKDPFFAWAPAATAPAATDPAATDPARTADAVFHAVALTCNLDTRKMELFVDGVSQGGPKDIPETDGKTPPKQTVIIADQFQWGNRHANPFGGEAAGAGGAITWMGVWKRVLTPEEIQAADTAVQSPAPTSSVTFDLPTGRMDLRAEAPAVAARLTAPPLGALWLESVPEAWQVRDGSVLNAAEIVGDSGSRRNIYGVGSAACNRTEEVTRDVWLKVSGGSHGFVVGGSETGWQGKQALWPRGTLVTELGPDASADHVVGVLHRSGDGVNPGGAAVTQPSFIGTAMVVVDGTVRGAIVGGAVSRDAHTPELKGITGVTVRSLQTAGEAPSEVLATGDRIVGGSTYGGNNSSSGAKHLLPDGVTDKKTVITYVDVLLPKGTVGTFDREIIGGSYATNAGSFDWSIAGSTAVHISAPNTVTFTRPIYGGSVIASGKTSNVYTSLIEISGGTYVSEVVAGCSGANTKAGQAATIMLKGGIFRKSATIRRAANKSPADSPYAPLIIDGEVDFTEGPTVAENFLKFKVLEKGVLKLGTWRGLPLPLDEVSGKVSVTLSDKELADGSAVIAFKAGTTGKFGRGQLEVTNLPDGWQVSGDGARGFFVAPADMLSWDSCFPNHTDGMDQTLGTGEETEPLKILIGRPVTAGAVTVKAPKTELAGVCSLTAKTLTVEAGAALTAEFGPERVNPASMTVRGTLEARGTVGGEVRFEKGSVLQLRSAGATVFSGTVSGEAALRLPYGTDMGIGFVLRAAEAPAEAPLTFAPPEGCRIFYRDGAYWVTNLPAQTICRVVLSPDTETRLSTQLKYGSLPVAPNQWHLLPTEDRILELAVPAGTMTVNADTALLPGTLKLRGIGTVELVGDGRLMPLTGMTVEEGVTLKTPVSPILLPEGSIIDGTLEYRIPSGNTSLPSTLQGAGEVVKTGSGYLQLKTREGKIWGTPTLIAREGSLHVQDNAAPGSIAGNVTLENGTCLQMTGYDSCFRLESGVAVTFRAGSRMELNNGRAKPENHAGPISGGRIVVDAPGGEVEIRGAINGDRARIESPISGEGTLVLTRKGDVRWTLAGPVTDAAPDRKLAVAVRCSSDGKAANPVLSGCNTFTGGLTVEDGAQLTLTDGTAAGCGDVTVGTGATLKVEAPAPAPDPDPAPTAETVPAPVTVTAGHALALRGTLIGDLVFADGAALDVTEGYPLPLQTTDTTFAGRWIVRALDSQVTEGLQLTAGSAVPTASEVQAPTVPGKVEQRSDGLWLVASGAPKPSAPDIVLPDGGTAVQPQTAEAVQQALNDSLGDRATAVKTVNLVPGTDGKQPLTSAAAENALAVFGSSIASVTAEGDTATVTVGYTFGITDIAVDTGLRKVTFTATVTDGSLKPAALAKDATISLFRGEEKIQTLDKMADGSVRFTVDLEDRAPLYKVRAERN